MVANCPVVLQLPAESGRPTSSPSESPVPPTPTVELNGGEEGEEETLELPPPMKPLSDNLLGGAGTLGGGGEDAQAKRVSYHIPSRVKIVMLFGVEENRYLKTVANYV